MIGSVLHIDKVWVVQETIQYKKENVIVDRFILYSKSVAQCSILHVGQIVEFDLVLVNPMDRIVDSKNMSQNHSSCTWQAKLRLDEDNNPKLTDWEAEIEKCKNSFYYFYTTYVLIEGKPATTRLTEEQMNRLVETTIKPYKK